MKIHIINPMRKEIADAALDSTKSATYLASMALTYMRDCASLEESIVGDAGLIAIMAEIKKLEEDEQAKRRTGYRPRITHIKKEKKS
jgi:hypothetical protein